VRYWVTVTVWICAAFTVPLQVLPEGQQPTMPLESQEQEQPDGQHLKWSVSS
jgi:hypothetical protein